MVDNTMSPRFNETTKDAHSAMAVTGRLQRVTASEFIGKKPPTLAAGAVVWREKCGIREYAIIHRPSYNDWSLPKGKVDPGEAFPQTAVREIREETGYQVTLGKLVGKVSYPVGSRTKVVAYFTGKYECGTFRTNHEVDTCLWLPRSQATAKLTYDVDKEVLTKADKRLSTPDQKRIIVVRHAHAYARKHWKGDDLKRPLDAKGNEQINALPAFLAPFRPTAVITAKPRRCQQTAAAIAKPLGLKITVDDRYGDNEWIALEKATKAAFTTLVAEPSTVPVIVSQGLIIPELIAWASVTGTLPITDTSSKKAGIWILTFHQEQLCGADYYDSPLPLR